MLESVRCPSCLTHYGLRPERVRPGLRKARCLRCKDVFRIEEAVARLLAEAEAVALQAGAPAPSAPIMAEDVFDLTPPMVVPATLLPPPAPEPVAEDFPVAAPSLDPALTLGDLEGADEEILERTLVIDPPEGMAVPAPETRAATPEESEMDLGGSYSSAKDAISKLLGDLPAAPAHAERRTGARTGQPMDVEATLDALENTLGGVQPKDLDFDLGTQPMPTVGRSSTVKLSAAEIQAAMMAGAEADSLPAPSAPTQAFPNPLVARVALTPPPPPTPVAVPVPPPAPLPPPAPAAAPQDPNLLKIEVGDEVFTNVTLEQMTTWIEQGRVQEWHMVARQFSDNWIEASKVPSLRPIFERVRRQGTPGVPPGSEAFPPAMDTAPMKKSLFGGLFKR